MGLYGEHSRFGFMVTADEFRAPGLIGRLYPHVSIILVSSISSISSRSMRQLDLANTFRGWKSQC